MLRFLDSFFYVLLNSTGSLLSFEFWGLKTFWKCQRTNSRYDMVIYGSEIHRDLVVEGVLLVLRKHNKENKYFFLKDFVGNWNFFI